MKKIIITLLIVSIFSAVEAQKKTPELNELIQVEEAFSSMSEEKGVIRAFEYFCDEEGVLLRTDRYPVTGKAAVMAELGNAADSLFTLTWKVSDGMIASSGELGYTFGIYLLDYTSEEIEDISGTYVTIWKKNKDGDWKFVLDTGQEGLGE